MFTIAKTFDFCASHVIEGLPPGHPCGRLHGHNYRVEVVLAAERLDERGFVVDFGDLKPFKQLLDEVLDHRHLNDVLPGPTTSECLAEYLYRRARALWPQTVAVRVSETDRTWAEYRPGPHSG